MSFESTYFDTEEYGVVGMTASPIDEHGEENAGTDEQLSSYDFSDNSDKTWGLATKFYVLSSIYNHNHDPGAHEGIFRDFLSKYSDALVRGAEFGFNAVNDLSGNVIYANGKVTYDNGRRTGYLVTSESKYVSFDAVSGELGDAIDGLRRTLEGKQDRLLAGENVSIDPETATVSAKDTVFVLEEATTEKMGGVYLDDTVAEGGRNPVRGGAVYDYVRQKARGAMDMRQWTAESSTCEFILDDNAVNAVDCTGKAGRHALVFPARVAGRARSFTLSVTLGGEETTVEFEPAFPLGFSYFSSDTGVFDAVSVSADTVVCVYRVTEIADNHFAVDRTIIERV